MTDNGACYRADAFARALLGSRHQRITPCTPRHNGKVERYNRILAEDFLYAGTWDSEVERSKALRVWNIHYSYTGPHRNRELTASGPTTRGRHERHGLVHLVLQP
ncbi:hypothetical protein GCM10010313_26610 [Streptomyces violarus]|nr:hypothetical protein GCM10010313_26610 [Streptomyces violarus]